MNIRYDARIRQLARLAWHHPITERAWQSSPGRFLRRAAGLPTTEKSGEVTRIEGVLVFTVRYGCNLRFFVSNRHDILQSCHFSGVFYEEEELQLIREHFRDKGTFVDIGANVGNHTIFAAKILEAKQVIPFELHPDAIAILMANIALNNCQNVDASFLGYGVSSTRNGCPRSEQAMATTWLELNFGQRAAAMLSAFQPFLQMSRLTTPGSISSRLM